MRSRNDAPVPAVAPDATGSIDWGAEMGTQRDCPTHRRLLSVPPGRIGRPGSPRARAGRIGGRGAGRRGDRAGRGPGSLGDLIPIPPLSCRPIRPRRPGRSPSTRPAGGSPGPASMKAGDPRPVGPGSASSEPGRPNRGRRAAGGRPRPEQPLADSPVRGAARPVPRSGPTGSRRRRRPASDGRGPAGWFGPDARRRAGGRGPGGTGRFDSAPPTRRRTASRLHRRRSPRSDRRSGRGCPTRPSVTRVRMSLRLPLSTSG